MSQEAIALKHADGSEPQPHQVGQNIFKTILSEDVDWEPFPAFPPSIRLAVVVGQPADPGPYTIRVKVPNGGKLMPHKHPEDRVYTVISGVFYIGLGVYLRVKREEKTYQIMAVSRLAAMLCSPCWVRAGGVTVEDRLKVSKAESMACFT